MSQSTLMRSVTRRRLLVTLSVAALAAPLAGCSKIAAHYAEGTIHGTVVETGSSCDGGTESTCPIASGALQLTGTEGVFTIEISNGKFLIDVPAGTYSLSGAGLETCPPTTVHMSAGQVLHLLLTCSG